MLSANTANPGPLPPCPGGFPKGSDLRKAFQVCEGLELRPGWSLLPTEFAYAGSEDIMRKLTPVCVARVLGFALLYSPSDAGRDNLAADILRCNDGLELLARLAHFYVFGFIKLFYNPKGGEPEISTEQSPAASAQAAEELRNLVMTREKYFCPVTGKVDLSQDDSEAEWELLEIVHIIGQSLLKGNEGGSEAGYWKANRATTTGAIIEHFGGLSPHILLDPENLDSPRNAMFLASFAHQLFDRLQLWFTPFVENGNIVPNKYKVNLGRNVWNKSIHPTSTFETFTLPDGGKIEPPSPELLALHANCAQIAHMSGAAKCLAGQT